MMDHENLNNARPGVAFFVVSLLVWLAPNTLHATSAIDGGALPSISQVNGVPTSCSACHAMTDNNNLKFSDQVVDSGTGSTILSMTGNSSFNTYTSIEDGAVTLSKSPTVAGLVEGVNNFDYCIIDTTAALQDSNTTRGPRDYNCDTVKITVSAAPNQDPVVSASVSSLSLQDGAQDTVTVTTSDPDNDTVTVTASSSSDAIARVTGPDGSGRFTVEARSVGSATISFSGSDGNGGSDSATVQVTVTAAPNQNPTISTNSNSLSIQTGQQDTVSVTTSDSDGDTVTVTAASSATAVATVSGPDGSGNYTVSAVSTGNATITFSASDGNGGTASASVQVTVTATPNQNPTITTNTNTLSIQSGQQGTVAVTTSDSDGDSVTVTAASSATAVATVSGPDGSGNYTVSAASTGTATITFSASDGNGGTASASVQVTVTATPNQNPTITTNTNSLSIQTGQQGTVAVTTGDSDGDTVTVTAASGATAVATVSGPDGSGNYTVSAVSTGTATITFSASDGNGGTASTTVQVTVSGGAVNQAPVVTTDVTALALQIGQQGFITVSTSDADGDTVAVTASSSAASVATVAGPDASGVYTISVATAGASNITFTADDGNGGSASTTVPITVTAAPVNQNPVLALDVASLSIPAGQQRTVGVTVSDADGDTVTVTANSSSTSVAAVTGPDAAGRYTVAAIAEGTAAISFAATDGNGGSANGSVAVTVTMASTGPDSDGDTVADATDNCPSVANANQLDTDSDGAGDRCDADANGDGRLDAVALLTVQQGSNRGVIGVIGSGLGEMRVITQLTSASDSDYTFDWTGSSSVLLNGGSTRIEGSTLIFNPDADAIPVGVYPVQLTYSADGLQAVARTVIVLIGNIGSEPAANFSDNDNDGYPQRTDNNDNNATTILLDSRTAGEVTANPGTSLSIGSLASLASALQNYLQSSVLLQSDQLQPVVTALYPDLNVSLDSGLTSLAGVINLELRRATEGGLQAVIRFPNGLPEQAAARAFLPLSGGWQTLAVDASNQIASATSSGGSCPSVGNAAYTAGLNAGADCVQLSLADGGANDSDGAADSVLRLILDIGQGDGSVTASGSGGGVLRAVDLLVLLLLLIAVGNRHYLPGLQQVLSSPKRR